MDNALSFYLEFITFWRRLFENFYYKYNVYFNDNGSQMPFTVRVISTSLFQISL